MITFYEYMKQSLGSSEFGYYTTRARIGEHGADFITAPETSSAFTSLVALQIMEIDESLGFPDPFYLIEAGPGNGTLAEGLLTIFQAANPSLFQRVSPFYYELPGVLAERQRERLSRFKLKYPSRWIHLQEPGDVEAGKGLVFGNEFLDALPVHRFRRNQEKWEECYVDQGPKGTVEVWGPLSSPRLEEEIGRSLAGGWAPASGQEIELSPDIPIVLSDLDRFLSEGFMLWIDYGDIKEELFSERRKRGTLLSYRRHTVTENLLEVPAGESDLTAYVDFSRIASILVERNYHLEGYTDQMSWLMGLGFQDWLEANAKHLSQEETVRAATLLHPLKMGRIFKALLMGKKAHMTQKTGFRFGGLRSPLEGD